MKLIKERNKRVYNSNEIYLLEITKYYNYIPSFEESCALFAPKVESVNLYVIAKSKDGKTFYDINKLKKYQLDSSFSYSSSYTINSVSCLTDIIDNYDQLLTKSDINNYVASYLNEKKYHDEKQKVLIKR